MDIVLELAKYVATPLSLTGAALGILLVIYHFVLKSKLAERLSSEQTFKLAHRVSICIFFVAIVAVVLGVASHTFISIYQVGNGMEDKQEFVSPRDQTTNQKEAISTVVNQFIRARKNLDFIGMGKLTTGSALKKVIDYENLTLEDRDFGEKEKINASLTSVWRITDAEIVDPGFHAIVTLEITGGPPGGLRVLPSKLSLRLVEGNWLIDNF